MTRAAAATGVTRIVTVTLSMKAAVVAAKIMTLSMSVAKVAGPWRQIVMTL